MRPCPVCASSDWAVAFSNAKESVHYVLPFYNDTSAQPAGHTKTITLGCRVCGFFRVHFGQVFEEYIATLESKGGFE
jgi:hypothetical protein